jgi:glutamate 5-kinase
VVANGRLPQANRSRARRRTAGDAVSWRRAVSPDAAPGKRRWIAFATTVEAAIVVNAGARRALVEGKASLLPAGLVEVRGHFARGDVVSILDADGSEFARGLMNYASDEAQAVLGQSSHRPRRPGRGSQLRRAGDARQHRAATRRGAPRRSAA